MGFVVDVLDQTLCDWMEEDNELFCGFLASLQAQHNYLSSLKEKIATIMLR